MAADVSSTMVKATGNSEILTTRDFLGALSQVSNTNLDLDLHLPKAWESSLDLKTGMAYAQRFGCTSPNSLLSSSSFVTAQVTELLPVSNSINPPLKFLEDNCHLPLQLIPNSNSTQYCQSVCTLDKVKSALERAGKEETIKKRFLRTPHAEHGNEKEEEGSSGQDEKKGMFAAGCPGCLMYVMLLKTNPICPRCNSIVPTPLPLKKPRIDLNASL